MVGVAFICCTFVAKIKCHSSNTVLFVKATIGFSESLFLVEYVYSSENNTKFMTCHT